MHIMLLPSVQRLPLIRLINVRQYIPFRMPREQLLRITAFYTVGLPSLLGVVDLQEVAVTAGSEVVAVRGE